MRDLDPPVSAVRPGILHLEAGMLRRRLLVAGEVGRRLDELGRELVGAAPQRQRRGPVAPPRSASDG